MIEILKIAVVFAYTTLTAYFIMKQVASTYLCTHLWALDFKQIVPVVVGEVTTILLWINTAALANMYFPNIISGWNHDFELLMCGLILLCIVATCRSIYKTARENDAYDAVNLIPATLQAVGQGIVICAVTVLCMSVSNTVFLGEQWVYSYIMSLVYNADVVVLFFCSCAVILVSLLCIAIPNILFRITYFLFSTDLIDELNNEDSEEDEEKISETEETAEDDQHNYHVQETVGENGEKIFTIVMENKKKETDNDCSNMTDTVKINIPPSPPAE